MKLTKEIEIVDLALLVNKKILIISDIHFGYEDALINQGYLIPRHQYKDTLEKINKILEKTKPETIIINGDLKHQFGSILRHEYTDSIDFLNFLKKNHEVILIKGNHDKILDTIAGKVNLKTQLHHNIGDIYICHGDFIPKDKEFEKAKMIIIGHEHPSITLEKNKRFEKFKCFLKGKCKNKILIVQPSFNVMTIGTDVTKERIQSPLINNIKNFEIFIVEDKVYDFGKVSNFIS